MAHVARRGPQGLLGEIIGQCVQVLEIDNRRVEVIGHQPGLVVVPELRFRHGIGIGVVGQAPVELPLHVGDGVEGVHNILAAVFQFAVDLVVPVVVQGNVHPVAGAGRLDGRVEYPKRLQIGPHVVGQVHGPHVVPVLLIVHLVSDHPVGHLAVVGVGAVVALRQKGGDGPGLLITRRRSHVEHIVVGAARLFDSRVNQIRRVVAPAV